MDKKSLREFTHNAGSFLTVDSSTYKQWIFRYTFLELEKDLGTKGDITTRSIFKDNKKIKANVVARSEGVIAGLEEIKYFLVDSDPSFKPNIQGNFQIDFKLRDGDVVKSGDIIMEIDGGVLDILAVERVVLNLLMRMSGVATFTRRIVDMVKKYDVLITPTRKTLWGLLDKKAVVVGGGGTHRLNLADAVLIKDNHLDLMDRDFGKVLRNVAEKDLQCRFIEIEVDTADEALKASEEFVKLIDNGDIKCVSAVMMDNMSADEIFEVLERLRGKKLYDRLLFEASGGITEKNVEDYAKTGVDIISMGCLTGGRDLLDIGMDLTN